jgi:hypothetical protein
VCPRHGPMVKEVGDAALNVTVHSIASCKLLPLLWLFVVRLIH